MTQEFVPVFTKNGKQYNSASELPVNQIFSPKLNRTLSSALLLHGADDDIVTPKNVDDLLKPLTEAGVSASAKVYPDKDHVQMVSGLTLLPLLRSDVGKDIVHFIETTQVIDTTQGKKMIKFWYFRSIGILFLAIICLLASFSEANAQAANKDIEELVEPPEKIESSDRVIEVSPNTSDEKIQTRLNGILESSKKFENISVTVDEGSGYRKRVNNRRRVRRMGIKYR